MRALEKLMTSFNLYLAFKEQSGFSQMLQNAQVCFAFQSFEQFGAHWEVSLKAIASIIPGTSRVESDFSLINWKNDFSSQSLTDFSLESILHCKQYQKLRDLFE